MHVIRVFAYVKEGEREDLLPVSLKVNMLVWCAPVRHCVCMCVCVHALCLSEAPKKGWGS